MRRSDEQKNSYHLRWREREKDGEVVEIEKTKTRGGRCHCRSFVKRDIQSWGFVSTPVQ